MCRLYYYTHVFACWLVFLHSCAVKATRWEVTCKYFLGKPVTYREDAQCTYFTPVRNEANTLQQIIKNRKVKKKGKKKRKETKKDSGTLPSTYQGIDAVIFSFIYAKLVTTKL